MMGKGFIRYKIKSFIIERGDFRNKLTSGVYKKMLSPQKLFFKSLVPEVSSNENIQDLIGYALAYQEYFERNVFFLMMRKHLKMMYVILLLNQKR